MHAALRMRTTNDERTFSAYFATLKRQKVILTYQLHKQLLEPNWTAIYYTTRSCLASPPVFQAFFVWLGTRLVMSATARSMCRSRPLDKPLTYLYGVGVPTDVDTACRDSNSVFHIRPQTGHIGPCQWHHYDIIQYASLRDIDCCLHSSPADVYQVGSHREVIAARYGRLERRRRITGESQTDLVAGLGWDVTNIKINWPFTGCY